MPYAARSSGWHREAKGAGGPFSGPPREEKGGRGAAALIAQVPHARCTPAPVRRSRQAGIDWMIAAFSCSDRRGQLVEVAGAGPAGAGLVYVQIAPPASSAPAFVDTLLAGVRVR